MSEESITDDERLLRRFHRQFLGQPPADGISHRVFVPRTTGRNPDRSGISLFRSACLSDPRDILSVVPTERRAEQGILEISVAAIRAIGLTVVRELIDEIPGHVVIPELNASSYERDRDRVLLLASQLLSASRAILMPRPIGDVVV